MADTTYYGYKVKLVVEDDQGEFEVGSAFQIVDNKLRIIEKRYLDALAARDTKQLVRPVL